MTFTEAINPSPQLLSKLGSIVVHTQEYLDPKHGADLNAQAFDLAAMIPLLNDPEVMAWLAAMGPLVPVKR